MAKAKPKASKPPPPPPLEDGEPCMNDAQRMQRYRKLGYALKAGEKKEHTNRVIPIWQEKDAIMKSGEPFFFRSAMAIDVDGAPWAYGPKGRQSEALDNLGNASHKYYKTWHSSSGPWPTDKGMKPDDWGSIVMDGESKPRVQGKGDPAPGFYISTTSLKTGVGGSNSISNQVDASAIPFFALNPDAYGEVGGFGLGDLAAMIHLGTGRLCYAVFADTKKVPHFEGSMALAQFLGVKNRSAKNGGEPHDLVLALVFPGSSGGVNTMLPPEQILAKATELYSDDWLEILCDAFGENAAAIRLAGNGPMNLGM